MADAKQIVLGYPTAFISTPGFSTHTLNQSNDAYEVVFQVPPGAATYTITRLGFLTSSLASTPDFKISLQGVNSSGNPDGTIKGGGSPASAVFNPTSLGWTSDSWHWITLDNSFAAAPGYYSIVVAYESGTIGASNRLTISTSLGNSRSQMPYGIVTDAGTRSRQVTLPLFGWGTASKAYGTPLKAVTGRSVNSGSTPDEYAVRFNLPAGYGDTFKIMGGRLAGFLGAASTMAVKLYDASDNVLADVTHDTDLFGGLAAPIDIYFDDTSLTDLSFATTYRLAFVPQDATNQTLYEMEVDSAADWDAWPGGQDFMLSTRTNAGAWTDTATKRFLAALILSDWTEPAGGGGGSTGGYVIGG